MPIGWVRDSAISPNRARATERNRREPSSFFDQIDRTVVAIAQDVALMVHRVLEAEVWTRWETASDETVCPVCGPYAGHVWKHDDGPHPPLHPNCRCRRVYAFTAWATR